jgi:transcriptional regulator with XRE-family HTH domain
MHLTPASGRRTLPFMELTLASIVGTKVRLLRDRLGTTQDEVAAAARSVGLGWGRSTVAELEAGSKRLSAEEFVLLPFVLLNVGGGDSNLADLLRPMDIDPPGDWVTLTPTARAKYTALVDLLDGTATALSTNTNLLDLPRTRDQRRAHADAIERLKGYRRIWPGTALHRLEEAERDASGEAEQKAARKVGVPAAHVAVAAHRLWGRGLTAERDRRVAERDPGGRPRSVQAARGHVTRQLMAELRPLFDDKED